MVVQLRSALMMFFILTILTGVAYPLAVTAIAQLLFPHQANGSLIYKDGKPIGSMLIGQPFDDPEYFWGRPSATAPFPYNAATSTVPVWGGSSPPNRDSKVDFPAPDGPTREAYAPGSSSPDNPSRTVNGPCLVANVWRRPSIRTPAPAIRSSWRVPRTDGLRPVAQPRPFPETPPRRGRPLAWQRGRCRNPANRE